jgi:hypothetical protein
MSYAALIFSHSNTPRLQYVVDFLSQYYGLSFRIISDEEKYRNSKDICRINYSYHRISAGEIFIHSHVLLFESSIRIVKIECFDKKLHEPNTNSTGYKAFFKTEGDVEFDLFAGIFYLLTRYEEYIPHRKDAFGRFPHQASVAFKENFLQIPLVNIWLEDFRSILAEKNPEFRKQISKFQFIPTYDIDIAWSFRHKGAMINAGAMIKLLLKFKFRDLIYRIKVLREKAEDPYDAYAWMDDLHLEYKLKPVYFFLLAIQKGRHDKNIDVDNSGFRELIHNISSKYSIGIHPSWASGDHPELVLREIKLLETISKKAIHASRQHFIRMKLPDTYQLLLKDGITEDHSMGYGSINGLRASIATPFYWYDLKHETSTKLLIYPFCFMDANAFYEQKLSAEEALEEMLQYYRTVKSVNGTMITLWHNSFLGTEKEFAGWREVYKRFVSEIC